MRALLPDPGPLHTDGPLCWPSSPSFSPSGPAWDPLGRGGGGGGAGAAGGGFRGDLQDYRDVGQHCHACIVPLPLPWLPGRVDVRTCAEASGGGLVG